jgi:dynein heavy chain
MEKVDDIVDIGEKASKEFGIETMLDAMLEVWDGINFHLKPHKSTYILSGFDDII